MNLCSFGLVYSIDWARQCLDIFAIQMTNVFYFLRVCLMFLDLLLLLLFFIKLFFSDLFRQDKYKCNLVFLRFVFLNKAKVDLYYISNFQFL